MGKKVKSNKKILKPFVSICTPTYNRRPFIKSMIKCFEHQTYPKDRLAVSISPHFPGNLGLAFSLKLIEE